jgi:Tfp pilus assembly protein PilZ
MSEEKAKPSDRRADVRHQAVFPAEIETEGGTSIAVIRDLSVSGAQLLTRSRFKVGDPVKLSLYILDDKNPRVVTGKIMRSGRRGSDYSDLWPNSVGIKFDEMLADCEDEVKAVAEQQLRSGLTSKATL